MAEARQISFIRWRDTWYAGSTLPDDTTVFMVGDYAPNGGCSWEFAICQELQPGKPMRLKMFSEAWVAFLDAPRFFVGLAELGEDATPDTVLALLLANGFEDCTEESRPERFTENVDL